MFIIKYSCQWRRNRHIVNESDCTCFHACFFFLKWNTYAHLLKNGIMKYVNITYYINNNSLRHRYTSTCRAYVYVHYFLDWKAPRKLISWMIDSFVFEQILAILFFCAIIQNGRDTTESQLSSHKWRLRRTRVAVYRPFKFLVKIDNCEGKCVYYRDWSYYYGKYIFS